MHESDGFVWKSEDYPLKVITGLHEFLRHSWSSEDESDLRSDFECTTCTWLQIGDILYILCSKQLFFRSKYFHPSDYFTLTLITTAKEIFLKSPTTVCSNRKQHVLSSPTEVGDQSCLYTASHWHKAKSTLAKILHEYPFQSKGEMSTEPPL